MQHFSNDGFPKIVVTVSYLLDLHIPSSFFSLHHCCINHPLSSNKKQTAKKAASLCFQVSVIKPQMKVKLTFILVVLVSPLLVCLCGVCNVYSSQKVEMMSSLISLLEETVIGS